MEDESRLRYGMLLKRAMSWKTGDKLSRLNRPRYEQTKKIVKTSIDAHKLLEES